MRVQEGKDSVLFKGRITENLPKFQSVWITQIGLWFFWGGGSEVTRVEMDMEGLVSGCDWMHDVTFPKIQ